MGHHSSSVECPALAQEEVKASTEAFRGGANPLSNLHVCSQDCSWENDRKVFTSVEQDYQYEKLNSHKKQEAADTLMQMDNTLEIKRSAQATLSEEEVSEWWSAREQDKMLEACW